MDVESGIHRHGIRDPQRGIRNPGLSRINLHWARFQVQFGINKHSYIFQSPQIALALRARSSNVLIYSKLHGKNRLITC